MLPHLIATDEIKKYINIKKSAKGKSAFGRGAFAGNEKLKIELEISRRLGVTKVYLCLDDDNLEKHREIELPFENLEGNTEFYSITLDFAMLCPDGDGLFFWKIKLQVGNRCF